jgi:phage tail sheath protein FI
MSQLFKENYMAFALSPGVQVTETDLTSIIPSVATSTGGFAGKFVWGPVLSPTQITSENQLVQRFGKPTNDSAQSFFTAANFLSYSNNLQLIRIDVADARNAVAAPVGPLVSARVVNPGSGFTNVPNVVFSSGIEQGVGSATLKVVGATVNNGGTGWALNDVFTVDLGTGTEATFRVSAVDEEVGVVTGVDVVSAGSYTQISSPVFDVSTFAVSSVSGSGLSINVALGVGEITVSGGVYSTPPTINVNNTGGFGAVINDVVIDASGIKINNKDDYDVYENGAGTVGPFAAKYPGDLGNSIAVSMADAASFAEWTYRAEFDSAPNTSKFVSDKGGMNDEMHIVVIDSRGDWTGVQGAILEKFAFVSKASDARKFDGSNNYYRDVINSTSKYVWWMDHPESTTNWGSQSTNTQFQQLSDVVSVAMSGGVTGTESADDGDYQDAFALLANSELYDISLIPTGHVSATVAKYVVEQVAESRRDCVAFVSPYDTLLNRPFTTAADIVAWRGDVAFNVNSSYAVMDSGYKYQYDRYNDVYRWVPLNGDIAGLCARTDFTNDPWWSPGGLNRGQIKNVTKLAFNPNKAERDDLYKSGVNPVVSFPGQGVVLFGDKTLLAKPSAFDRINVRRLFIVLEKAIATAAKYQLFEFNDSFTRAQFRSMVEPFLRNVQGRRGIVDFRVVCDDSNNTGEVIDRNEFIADIFVKPARSINFVTLNFVAVRSGISFDEIGG